VDLPPFADGILDCTARGVSPLGAEDSVWAIILFRPTLIRMVYGVNFDHSEELHWHPAPAGRAPRADAQARRSALEDPDAEDGVLGGECGEVGAGCDASAVDCGPVFKAATLDQLRHPAERMVEPKYSSSTVLSIPLNRPTTHTCRARTRSGQNQRPCGESCRPFQLRVARLPVRSAELSKLSEKSLWRQESDASMLTDREQVFPVSGGEDVRSRLGGTGENHVVCRIACDRLDNRCRCRFLCRELCEERTGRVDLLLLEVELGDQHPLEFREDELGDE
jgi:hypothetical protein